MNLTGLKAEQEGSKLVLGDSNYNWNGPKITEEKRKFGEENRRRKKKIWDLYKHSKNSLYTTSAIPLKKRIYKQKFCLSDVNQKNIEDISEAIRYLESENREKMRSYFCPDIQTGNVRKIKETTLKKIQQWLTKETKKDYKPSDTSISIHPPLRKTRYSIVLMHGLFMSPLQMEATQKLYTKLGFNVINLKLPGHGTRKNKGLKKIQWEDWDKELKHALKIAQEIGDKVLVSGHSLGGLLAYKAALGHVYSPKNNTAIVGMLNFSPALKTATYLGIAAYLGTALNLVLPNATDFIFGSTPEPGVEVSQLAEHLTSKYAIKTNQRQNSFYDSVEFVDWDKERIKEMYSGLKNIPILQVDSKYDLVIDYDENKQVMQFLKGQNNTLHIEEDVCLASLLKDYSKASHMLSNMYLEEESHLKQVEEYSFLCGNKLRNDQLKILKFIDKNFPERCK